MMNTIDLKKVEWMQENIKEGDVVADIGACFGLFTEPLSILVGDTGYVFAFEPRSANFKSLNERLGNKKNTILLNIGLSDHDRTDAPLYIVEGYYGWNSFEASVHYVTRSSLTEYVDIKTLDEVLAAVNITKLDFIKIDVEGYDLRVLNGALKTIFGSNNIKIMMEAHTYVNTKEEFLAFFTKYGFKVYNIETMELVTTPEQLTTEILAVRNL
jgi:FkbM family methyltransferase